MPILTTLILSGIAASIASKMGVVKKSNERVQRITHRAKKYGISLNKIKKEKALPPKEMEIKQQQYVAFGALSFFSLGMLFYPVFALVGLPLLAYNYFYYIRKLREAYRKKRNLSVLLFDLLSVGVTIVMGMFLVTALVLWVLFTAQRLIAKTEREAHIDFNRIFGELANTTWLLKDGIEIEVPLNSLNVLDIIVVRAGEMIPVDGHILAGEGMLDQHLLTGESQPIDKKTGDEVFTSTLLISGTLQIRVEKQGAETITGQIARSLEHAASFKNQVQSRGDQIVEKGASRTLLACAAALPVLGLNHSMALSYSGFGYQMRIAAPLTVLNYLRIASRSGVLIKDGRALDKLQGVNTIVFDKTGTLTEEMPHIERLVACADYSKQQVLQYAASAEQRQKHPIAQAICHHANIQALPLLELVNSDYAIGHGLRAELIDPTQVQQKQTILIGSRRFIDTAGIAVPKHIERMQQEADEKGYSIVYIASDKDILIGAIELRPTIRPQAHNVIKALHDLGMTLYIISGDQESPTRYLAEHLGVDHYFSETLPEDKARHVEALQAQGHKVCFIGDGINDSVALQKADVSISLHGAATIAQDTADIVLMTPNLLHLPYLLTLSKELHQHMNHSQWFNNMSGIACVSGVLLFGMGLSGAVLLYSGGLLANTSSAMLPLLKHVKKTGSD